MDCNGCEKLRIASVREARRRERVRVNVNPDSQVGSTIMLTEIMVREARDEVRALRREIIALQRQLERNASGN